MSSVVEEMGELLLQLPVAGHRQTRALDARDVQLLGLFALQRLDQGSHGLVSQQLAEQVAEQLAEERCRWRRRLCSRCSRAAQERFGQSRRARTRPQPAVQPVARLADQLLNEPAAMQKMSGKVRS